MNSTPEHDHIGATTVCPAGDPFLRLLVVRRDGWWVVEDQSTRECLTGGFKTKTEAVEWARGWPAEKGYTCPTLCVEQNHPGREHEEWLWPCDNHASPSTCLSVGAPEAECCRVCRIRAADRIIAALRTRPASEVRDA